MAEKQLFTNEVGYMTNDAVFIGDFVFEFEGNLFDQYKQWSKAKHTGLKEYENKVLELMANHYAYYGQFKKESEYVKKGPILWCDKGNKLSYFDMIKDHGVTSGDGGAIGICSDCKAGQNIYNFGACKVPAPPGMPERKQSFSEARFAPKDKTKGDVSYPCFPIMAGEWQKTVDADSQLKIWDDEDKKYYEAVKKSDFLTCAYGGLIYVVQVPSKDNSKTSITTVSEEYMSFLES